MKTIYSRMHDQSRRNGKVIPDYSNHSVDLRPKPVAEPKVNTDPDLHRVARVVHDFPLKYTVRDGGTVKCSVRFQMNKDQAAIVRKHYGIKPTDPIQFVTSEVTALGLGGWYTAFSMSDKVDEALKAILNIKSALWHHANGVTPPVRPLPACMAELKAKQEPARQVPSLVVRSKEPVVAKPTPTIRRVVVHNYVDKRGKVHSVAIDRHAQAEQHKPTGDQAVTERIKHLMRNQPPKPLPDEKLATSVNALRAHFGK